MPENDSVIMSEIAVNSVEEKKSLKFNKKPKERDVLDYVILEVGIACGIMLVLLAVNLIGTFSLADVLAVNTLIPNLGATVI